MMKKEKDIKIRYFLCPVSRLGTISGYYAEGKFKSYIDEWIGVPLDISVLSTFVK